MPDRTMDFSRSRNGYSPLEVDAVILELQRQISDQKRQNATLAATISQYEEKLQQAVENCQQLQNMRTQDNLRLSSVMTSAAEVAQKLEREAQTKVSQMLTEAQQKATTSIQNARQEAIQITQIAQQEASGIRSQADTDFASARTLLTKLNQTILRLRQCNEQYTAGANAQLVELYHAISGTLDGIPGAFASSAAGSGSTPPLTVPHAQAMQTHPQRIPPISPSGLDKEPDAYLAFAKKLRAGGQHPTYESGGDPDGR